MKSITRFGDIQKMFGGGSSPLLTSIARLSVLYEDFRIEYSGLQAIAEHKDGNFDRYRFIYLLRRSIATMNEFRGVLTVLVGAPEFKAAAPSLSGLDRASIDAANRYFQKYSERVKDWRNAVGGHFQQATAETACRNIPPGSIGSVTWNSGDHCALSLQLNFAEHLVAAAIGGELDGVDVAKEIADALNELIEGYVHMQSASYALIHAFLWDKFGR